VNRPWTDYLFMVIAGVAVIAVICFTWLAVHLERGGL
jgi:hypothetical protein